MAITRGSLEKIFDCIDQEELCQLALDLTAIPSPTGEEAALGEFILDWFAAQGLEPVRQEVERGSTERRLSF